MTRNNEELFRSLLLALQTKSCLVDLAPANPNVIAYLATCNQVTFVAYSPFGSDELVVSRGVTSISSKDNPLAEEIFSLVVEQEEAKALQKLSIGRIKHGDYGIPEFNPKNLEKTEKGGNSTTNPPTDIPNGDTDIGGSKTEDRKDSGDGDSAGENRTPNETNTPTADGGTETKPD